MDQYRDALKKMQQRDRLARLYALVDGGQFADTFQEPITPTVGVSLFAGTTDEPLAHAGPWLIDVEAEQDLCECLAGVQETVPVCSWLISSVPMVGLAQLLQMRMEAELPDGQLAILRFFDPRVIHRMAVTLDPQQLTELCEDIHEWHFCSAGQHHHIGREHA